MREPHRRSRTAPGAWRTRRLRSGPGGVGDGLPTLPSGEPVLARWFVVTVLALVVAGVAVTVWAFASVSRPPLDPAARRPPGTAGVTHDRGDVRPDPGTTAEPGPGCARAITVVGSRAVRAAAGPALTAVCDLLADGGLPAARRGLERWSRTDGLLRMAAFQLTGVDSTARWEGSRLVVELNTKFQLGPGVWAAPVVIHELVHVGNGMPGRPVTAAAELAAVRGQATACRRLELDGRSPDDPESPRSCRDAAELLAAEDPLDRLRAVGYPTRPGQPAGGASDERSVTGGGDER